MAITTDAALFGQGLAFPPRLGDDGRVAWAVGHRSVARVDPDHPHDRAGGAADAADVRRRAALVPVRAERAGHAPADRGARPARPAAVGAAGRRQLDRRRRAPGRPGRWRPSRSPTRSSPPRPASGSTLPCRSEEGGPVTMLEPPPIDARTLPRAARRGHRPHPGAQPGVAQLQRQRPRHDPAPAVGVHVGEPALPGPADPGPGPAQVPRTARHRGRRRRPRPRASSRSTSPRAGWR